MGMAGGLSLPRPIPRDAIRREGARLGYVGEGLEDFTEIITRIDDDFIEVTVRRTADEARRAADRARSKGR